MESLLYRRYADDCDGFLPDSGKYRKNMGYERCSPCRNYRRILRRKDANVEKEHQHLSEKKREVKDLLRHNELLQQRVCKISCMKKSYCPFKTNLVK